MKQVKPCPFECNANDCKDCGAYTYSHHTQTNEEWLRQCTTEQLAEFLYETGFMGMWQVDMMRNAEKEKITVEETIQRWLKQPHPNE